jgi:hypothetical protein
MIELLREARELCFELRDLSGVIALRRGPGVTGTDWQIWQSSSHDMLCRDCVR